MRQYILGVLAWFILCPQAFGVMISPLVVEINTDYRLTSQLIVTNNSTEKLALEANVHQLEFSTNGAIKTSESQDKDVLIFPPAVLLGPGEHQTFRVQWISKKPLKLSKSYFIRFSTANIDRIRNSTEKYTNAASGINIQIHYNALLHLYSSSLQPNVRMDIKKQGRLTLINSGSRFTFITALHFKNLDDNDSQALYQDLGEQFLPPHSTITLNSSLKNLPVGTYYGHEY